MIEWTQGCSRKNIPKQHFKVLVIDAEWIENVNSEYRGGSSISGKGVHYHIYK